MRSAILAFVAGVWWLQQQAALPALAWVALLLPLAAASWRLCHRPLIRHVVLLPLAAIAGFLWAAGMAQWRLADALPAEWQGEDIQLTGVVASLPQLHERGERFLFDVESVATAEAHVPRRISLTRYFAGYREKPTAARASQFHAGERWQLTVRLKRPHGSYNPHGFDFEAWALERNIRASGYLRHDDGNRRLQALVYRPGYLVERLREQVRARFDRVLGEVRYGGVLRALAIGDDDAIADEDWQLFRRTGVVHLMSI